MFRWQQCPPQILINHQISKLRLQFLQCNCDIDVVIFVVLQRVKLPEPLKKNLKKYMNHCGLGGGLHPLNLVVRRLKNHTFF